ncbi:MAG: ComEC/Rec2 family competence protein, partial [Rhodospirillaceae bacterium]
MRYPAVPPAAALVCGAALGVGSRVPAGAMAASLTIGVALSVVCWRERVVPAFVMSALVAAGASGFALAATASQRATHTSLRAVLDAAGGSYAVSDAPGDPVTIVGRLKADAAPADNGVRLSLSARQVIIDGREHRAAGGVLLTVSGAAAPAQMEEWRQGRIVRLPAQLRRPSRYLNPGAGDEETALALRGTTLVGSVKSAMLVQGAAPGAAPAEAAAALRLRVRRIVDDHVGVHGTRSAAIVRAILLGDRAGLDAETEERLQQAGTYHVIAISGGNIAVFAAALMVIAAVAGLRPGAAHVAAAIVLAGYAYLVGGGPSVLRATLMAVLYLLAHAVDHRARPSNAIGASAWLTCAFDPLSVRDAGAWLTYGATIAILAGTPIILARLRGRSLVLIVPASLLAATLSAELALFPVSALVFSRVTAAGLVVNFAAIPLMSAVQAGGMALVALHPVVPAAAPAVGWLTHLAAWAL